MPTYSRLGPWGRAAGRPQSWGATGVQRPAEDGVRWRFLANRNMATGRRFAWFYGYFAASYEAPPVGFEPTHTAPEAVALSPELWGPGDDPCSRRTSPIGTQQHYQCAARSGHATEPVCGVLRARGRTARAAHPGTDNVARVTQALGRVLVVDDDEVIRQLIAVNLTLEGFDVATAVDGQDCLDKVAAIAPQVITLDVMMPRLDGWVTAVELRKNPQTSHIKVVLITARAQEDDKDRGHQNRRGRLPDQAVRPGRDDPRGPRTGRRPAHCPRLSRRAGRPSKMPTAEPRAAHPFGSSRASSAEPGRRQACRRYPDQRAVRRPPSPGRGGRPGRGVPGS